jgi:hypothetical protein
VSCASYKDDGNYYCVECNKPQEGHLFS